MKIKKNAGREVEYKRTNEIETNQNERKKKFFFFSTNKTRISGGSNSNSNSNNNIEWKRKSILAKVTHPAYIDILQLCVRVQTVSRRNETHKYDSLWTNSMNKNVLTFGVRAEVPLALVVLVGCCKRTNGLLLRAYNCCVFSFFFFAVVVFGAVTCVCYLFWSLSLCRCSISAFHSDLLASACSFLGAVEVCLW